MLNELATDAAQVTANVNDHHLPSGVHVRVAAARAVAVGRRLRLRLSVGIGVAAVRVRLRRHRLLLGRRVVGVVPHAAVVRLPHLLTILIEY